MDDYFLEESDEDETIVPVPSTKPPALKRQNAIRDTEATETDDKVKKTLSEKRLAGLEKARLARSKNCLEKRAKKETMKKVLKSSESMVLVEPSEIDVLKQQMREMKELLQARNSVPEQMGTNQQKVVVEVIQPKKKATRKKQREVVETTETEAETEPTETETDNEIYKRVYKNSSSHKKLSTKQKQRALEQEIERDVARRPSRPSYTTTYIQDDNVRYFG